MDQENEIMTADNGTVALLNRSEIDMQIATAHKYPRSIKAFRDEVLQMVTLNEKVAQECIYSLPRREKDPATGGWVVKAIEGPSARFAEVVASAWGNSRAGSRVVSDAGDFVTAQGVFHDLQRNVAITYEVQRRITTSQGQRFKADMIGVTANAACSIALRNAILKGVPKAFWSDMLDAARETAIGNVQTLVNRRSRALAVLQKMGVQSDTVFAFLQIKGIEDVTLEHLATLFGITTALKEGDTTPEQAFSTQAGTGTGPVTAPRSKSEAAKPVEKAEVVQPTVEKAAEVSRRSAEAAIPVTQPRPTAGQAADKATGELPASMLASESQIRWAKSKIDALELPPIEVAAMLEKAGAASVDAMTLDQYDFFRSELLEAGA